MQFSAVQDVNAPLDFVFSQLSDFDAYEAYGMRIGAKVERRDTLHLKGAGMRWNVVGEFRGKVRDVDIELTEYRPDNLLRFHVESNGIAAEALIEAMALTRKQTRLKTTVDLTPKTLAARLILQSARLARQSLNKKFQNRLWSFAEHIESNYNRAMRA